MPRKTKASLAAEAVTPQSPAELLEQLIPGPVTPAEFESVLTDSGDVTIDVPRDIRIIDRRRKSCPKRAADSRLQRRTNVGA